MSEMSNESLAAACAEKVKQLEFSVKQSAFDSVRHELETELAIARVALSALRERAEPVAESDHVRREVHVGGNTWVQCSAQAYERAKAEGKITRELYEWPAQPVAAPDDLYKIANHIASAKGGLPDEWQDWAEEIETDIRRAAMLAAPGKQQLSVETLSNVIRNAPLAPSDNQGRQRDSSASGKEG
ncbi:hypothetical protein SMZ39_002019 [Cronobacter turicensis]|nr:hypothetical protein [Cronobacter turicensis]ELY4383754.1 hypothetical protein [Cronobacter turicensis]